MDGEYYLFGRFPVMPHKVRGITRYYEHTQPPAKRVEAKPQAKLPVVPVRSRNLDPFRVRKP